MFVEAGNEGKFFAAGFDETVVGADANFFKGFEAISDKSRADQIGRAHV